MEINIMVIDSCNKEIEKVKQALDAASKLSELKHVNLNPVTFSNSMDAATSKKKFHVALIEVEMSQMSGFELAAILNKKQPECLIIFLTNQMESYRMSYKVRTYDYLLKSFEQAIFNEMMISVVGEFRSFGAITVKKNSKAVKLKHVDILYAEPFGNGSTVYDIHGNEFDYQFSLKKLEAEVPEWLFFRCHHHFLVNLKYCNGWDKDKRIIILKAKTATKKIMISNRKLTEVEHAIQNYRFKRGEN